MMCDVNTFSRVGNGQIGAEHLATSGETAINHAVPRPPLLGQVGRHCRGRGDNLSVSSTALFEVYGDCRWISQLS